MTKTDNFFRIFSWVVFWLENILIVSVPIVTQLHPKDVTAISDSLSKVIFSLGFLAIIIVFQIITYFAIKNISNKKWNIVLLVLGIIHNPLYLISSIGFLISEREN
ncbi:hypothetical protein [Companilactobacillus hulinensis]|uniref:hypothetical protein n=1 Tax=Companilactobacillus hulinensis TaxID=2486007 RepID=UPI000F77CE16|nr:hypothetical protein [Companilactobacillus hulinensis]